MSETCPKCKRVRPPFAVHDDDEFLGFAACYGPTTHSCQIVTAARHDGMREGVDIALSNVRTRVEWIDQDDGLFEVLIEDDEVHAELERRLRGGDV